MAYESLSDSNYAGPGGIFFRQDAKLVVIFVSDEPDHTHANWSSYTSFFDQLKPAGYFIPFGIIGDPPSGCGNGWQGAHNVRFLQRVHVASQEPLLLPPDGLVLINDDCSKRLYENVVSKRPDMRDLHSKGATPHDMLRRLLAGTPRRKHEWRVLKPTPAEVRAWLHLVPLASFMSTAPVSFKRPHAISRLAPPARA